MMMVMATTDRTIKDMVKLLHHHSSLPTFFLTLLCFKLVTQAFQSCIIAMAHAHGRLGMLAKKYNQTKSI